MSQLDDALVAIEMLLEQIDLAIKRTNTEGARAFQRGDYEKVDAMEERAVDLRRFRRRVEGLTDEWRKLSSEPDEASGSITPVSEYRVPLLGVLEEAGGGLQWSRALERVKDLMADRLTERDREHLESGSIRWRNACRRARRQLVDAGLIRDGSPYGIWALSDEGWRAATNNVEEWSSIPKDNDDEGGQDTEATVAEGGESPLVSFYLGGQSTTSVRVLERGILEALVALGGSAERQTVLARLEQDLASDFTEADLEAPSPDYPERPRWHGTADRARQRLVDGGLLRDDSDYGVWEISDKGRRALEEGEV